MQQAAPEAAAWACMVLLLRMLSESEGCDSKREAAWGDEGGRRRLKARNSHQESPFEMGGEGRAKPHKHLGLIKKGASGALSIYPKPPAGFILRQVRGCRCRKPGSVAIAIAECGFSEPRTSRALPACRLWAFGAAAQKATQAPAFGASGKSNALSPYSEAQAACACLSHGFSHASTTCEHTSFILLPLRFCKGQVMHAPLHQTNS